MRIALYYSPPQTSVLHDLGSRWLGYNAYTGQSLDQPGDGLLKDLTEQASRYGLHATLKAPFHLKEGATFEDFKLSTAATAQELSAVAIPRLVLSSLDGFLALTPEIQNEDVNDLAATCVRRLDHLRAPVDEAELKRRGSAALSSRQNDLLINWGYPYVFDEFRFHITLTRKLTDSEMVAVFDLAESHFAQVLRQPLDISALTTFVEAGPDIRFRVVDTFSLTANLMAAFA